MVSPPDLSLLTRLRRRLTQGYGLSFVPRRIEHGSELLPRAQFVINLPLPRSRTFNANSGRKPGEGDEGGRGQGGYGGPRQIFIAAMVSRTCPAEVANACLSASSKSYSMIFSRPIRPN